ncbi:4,5:9,10-diseco-3-hydroxy-5,9, 17-trioxoandrosta-1(10),2-diene-4-oate hydrolase [Pigmentiphaga humi]|uniref:4,5:9,10-diseco-3-hydroxy-5,9, 17-trioxoandrosta-1(10),2-diene-4-oate hydrolase n=1 Tax=Pigmentiphaga humi TaxID=2478468 RepID=A0A3P4B255_9BURK|nr:alpha/beta fold hydrolase [Pigmentiphaga humi]VCU70367.1 4,5:9,10-diseco-3-hydroxy-5,9, 17-trioxoandrosta-1(10),2-diene-4-oate hydrolase [Pigmentiphaga humi]
MRATVDDVQAQAAAADTAIDGGRMSWRIWGKGPPVVLVHGNGGSWTHWLRNVLPLSRHFTLLLPDLPGHGDSDLPAGEASCAAFAAMLWQGLDQLLGPQASPALAGFSLGSVLVESMAMQRPAQVPQVVLLRGGFRLAVPPQPELLRWRGVEDPAERARIHRHNLAVLMFGDASRIDDEAVAVHAANLERCRLDVRPLLASRQVQAYTGLRCGVHGIAGERDVYGGGEASAQERALKDTLPQATFDLVPGAGHWAAYEAAEQVNSMMAHALMRGVRT